MPYSNASSRRAGGNHDGNDEVNDNDSSMIFPSTASIDSSNHFVYGDYEHNREVLATLDAGVDDDDDDERLIYESTRKVSRRSSRSFRPIYGALVHSGELQRSSTDFGVDRDGTQSSSTTQNADSQRLSSGTRNIFLIFQRDDRYLRVSREEIRRVRAMHRRFREGSEFCFNYNTLLAIASVIAALGLGSDSVATIIASMLVSPLMGPVMGMAYAATILDMKLFRKALVVEMVSLLVCIAAGAVVAACAIPFTMLREGTSSASSLSSSASWPTNEMLSRTELFSVYIGVPTAFASGLGVAVSVLDDQTSSLVGVAISASLLPPAVNAGMLWVTYFFFDEEANATHDFFVDGCISLALALVNIALIILASMLMFRVKEVRDGQI